MIYCLKGELIEKHPNVLIICVGGVYFEVNISLNCFTSLPEIGAEIKIYTYMVVREDAIILYGFKDIMEKKLFILLNTVSKVGPKISIAILSGIESSKFRIAVAQNDVSLISSIPGVGRKTAERIILELKDKFDETSDIHLFNAEDRPVEDVISALINFGYKKQECMTIVKKLSEEYRDFESLLKMSLKEIGIK